MTIVVRNDKPSGITNPGISAKLVSLAVIKAYQKCQEYDPPSLYQWEANAWTKIALKVHSEKEIRDIGARAEAEGINHYILEREVTLRRPKATDAAKVEEAIGDN